MSVDISSPVSFLVNSIGAWISVLSSMELTLGGITVSFWSVIVTFILLTFVLTVFFHSAKH